MDSNRLTELNGVYLLLHVELSLGARNERCEKVIATLIHTLQ